MVPCNWGVCNVLPSTFSSTTRGPSLPVLPCALFPTIIRLRSIRGLCFLWGERVYPILLQSKTCRRDVLCFPLIPLPLRPKWAKFLFHPRGRPIPNDRDVTIPRGEIPIQGMGQCLRDFLFSRVWSRFPIGSRSRISIRKLPKGKLPTRSLPYSRATPFCALRVPLFPPRNLGETSTRVHQIPIQASTSSC